MKSKIVDAPLSVAIKANNLQVGELAEIVEDFPGEIVLKHFEGMVSLTSPNHTWSNDCTLEVRRFPVGTIIKLKVKDND